MEDDARADPYADRYGATYSIYGDLDIDALLVVARPRSPFELWRKGDVRSAGRLARSSGVPIDICEDRNARVDLVVVGYPCDDYPGP